jgi:hypothetical protein
VTDLGQEAARILGEAGFEVQSAGSDARPAHTFENDTVLGFLLAYNSPTDLVACWSKDIDHLTTLRQFQLRAAGTKAWNCYAILLARGQADQAQAAALNVIEEDLGGVRKIAKAVCENSADVVAALLPLLPVQTGAILDAVDTRAEIRQRTTELPNRVVEAFLSAADPQVVLQLLDKEL